MQKVTVKVYNDVGTVIYVGKSFNSACNALKTVSRFEAEKAEKRFLKDTLNKLSYDVSYYRNEQECEVSSAIKQAMIFHKHHGGVEGLIVLSCQLRNFGAGYRLELNGKEYTFDMANEMLKSNERVWKKHIASFVTYSEIFGFVEV